MNWETRITGHDADLRMLAQAFTGPSVTIAERGSEFFLGGTDFAPFTDARTVRDKAREILASVSGASKLRLGSSKPVEVDHVVQLDGEKRHLTIFPEPVVLTLRALPVTLAVTRADGTVERHLPADPVVEDLRKAAQCEAVRRVLRLRNLPDIQMRDLANILEIIQADSFPLTKAEKDDAGRVTGSANHPEVAGDLARHAAPKWDAPPEEKRVELHEARELVDRIIRRWLASK
jgi:hypothetical protein